MNEMTVEGLTQPLQAPEVSLQEKRRLSLVMSLARGMAIHCNEEAPFTEGRRGEASTAERELRQEYIDDARGILDATGIFDKLAIASRCPPVEPEPDSCEDLSSDEVEAFIAGRIADAESIDRQIQLWESGLLERPDPSWRERARIALKVVHENIAFGHRLRLRILRRQDFAELIAGRDRQIEKLLATNRRDRAKRVAHTGRTDVQLTAIKNLIRQKAPELLDEALEVASAAAADFDEEQARKAILESASDA